MSSYVENLAGGFRHIVAESVKDTIICIDDIERKGDNLSVSDIFGLVNQLKEMRSCKIIFIFNKDGLDESEKKSFELYFEKVIDASVDFDPTPEEAIEIALPESDEISDWLRINCLDLRISNIRIIRKILRTCLQFNEIVSDVRAGLRRDMLRSLTFLAWAIFVPKDAPPLSFLNGWGWAQWVGLEKNEKADESAWVKILQQYKFTNFDDLDRLMVAGIQKGYFDKFAIAPEVKRMQEVYERAEGNAGLDAAWRKYHDSFDNDEDAVADDLFVFSINNIKYLSALNLNSAYTILEGIGYPDKATALLEAFIRENADTPSVFDLSIYPFKSEVTNLEILKAFEAQAKANEASLPSPPEAAKAIFKGRFSPENEQSLAQLSAVEFESLFRRLRGDELISVVQGALGYRQIANATPEQKAITATALEALNSIAADSALNKFRMKKFGL